MLGILHHNLHRKQLSKVLPRSQVQHCAGSGNSLRSAAPRAIIYKGPATAKYIVGERLESRLEREERSRLNKQISLPLQLQLRCKC